ncbi:MAG: UDP-N-acetylglucosamine 2-epimerase (non-hydrolyzing) [Candidatus Bathyarchaeota archaeon]|jgi:UDP-N-acetylglucosamine 2-epimerase
MKVMLVLGARPQIIKSAPLIHEISKDSEIELQIVHTGQHYDYEMSKAFFDELALPSPLINLEVGSGSHGWQTGKMLMGMEKVILKWKPKVIIVPGDTNSTLAGALAAVKLHVPVAHLEAGARSYDIRMPEEVNRRLTDHCARLLFATTENCVQNLSKEGVSKDHICLSGDTMYDALVQHLPRALKKDVLKKFNLEEETYGVLTLHRPENVDQLRKLENTLRTIMKIEDLIIFFPVHPRTKKMLGTAGLLKSLRKAKNLRFVDPVRYHSMLVLIKNAKIAFTDSGGVQKEAFWLHTPCVTLREATEWTETVELGANTLAKEQEAIIPKAREFLACTNLKETLQKLPNPFGDGRASEKIVSSLKRFAAT